MIPNDYLWHGLFMGMKTPATWVCLREKLLGTWMNTMFNDIQISSFLCVSIDLG